MTPGSPTDLDQVHLYQGVFASLQDGLVIVRLEGAPPELSPKIVDANPAAREISLDPTAQYLGVSAEQYFAHLFDGELGRVCRSVLQTGKPRDLGEIRSKEDGYFHVRILPLPDNHLALVLSDTTMRNRAVEALHSLRKLSTSLQSTVNFERILDQVLQGAMAIVGGESGCVSQCCAEGVANYRYYREGKLVPVESSLSADRNIPGRIVALKEAYVSNDAQNDAKIDPAQAAPMASGPPSLFRFWMAAVR